MELNNLYMQAREIPRKQFGAWLYGPRDKFPNGKDNNLPNYIAGQGLVRAGFILLTDNSMADSSEINIDGEIFKIGKIYQLDYRDHISGKQLPGTPGWTLEYKQTIKQQSQTPKSEPVLTE